MPHGIVIQWKFGSPIRSEWHFGRTNPNASASAKWILSVCLFLPASISLTRTAVAGPPYTDPEAGADMVHEIPLLRRLHNYFLRTFCSVLSHDKTEPWKFLATGKYRQLKFPSRPVAGQRRSADRQTTTSSSVRLLSTEAQPESLIQFGPKYSMQTRFRSWSVFTGCGFRHLLGFSDRILFQAQASLDR